MILCAKNTISDQRAIRNRNIGKYVVRGSAYKAMWALHILLPSSSGQSDAERNAWKLIFYHPTSQSHVANLKVYPVESIMTLHLCLLQSLWTLGVVKVTQFFHIDHKAEVCNKITKIIICPLTITHHWHTHKSHRDRRYIYKPGGASWYSPPDIPWAVSGRRADHRSTLADDSPRNVW